MKRIAIVLLFALGALAQNSAQPSSGGGPEGPQNTQAKKAPEDPGARKARDLVDKMIKALGGDAYLSIQDMEQSGRTYSFYHGEPQGAGALFWSFWKWPDKERVELTKQRDVVVIYNGDQGYEVTFRGTNWAEKPALEDYLRRRHYSLQNVLRNWLKEPDIALFYEGFASAERRPAEQVTIMNSKNEALTIYIDQNNFLPLKKTFRWRDPTYHDKTEEDEVYDNYRLVQGVMTPFSITRKQNGWSTNQRFIFEVKYNQKLSDSLFAARVPENKPKGQ